jgi:signal transduction histidine kinase
MNQEKENAEKANILKTEFIATISHELRTPLNSIIGYTQCLLDEIDGPLNPEQLSDLDKVLHNAENLLRLINDILDLSRLELDNTGFIYEDLAIGPLVSEAIKTIKPLADARGLKIYTELDNAARVKSDAFRLQQVLVNLLSNAVKFTHVGHITVTADQNTVPGYVTFSIADTGIGFEPQAQEYIFDRFRQADGSITRKYGGTGLGLSICKSLVHLLGGNIWASSQPGMGSTFYFTIPRERPSGSREDEENCLYDD